MMMPGHDDAGNTPLSRIAMMIARAPAAGMLHFARRFYR
jgi:hypothetical protein